MKERKKKNFFILFFFLMLSSCNSRSIVVVVMITRMLDVISLMMNFFLNFRTKFPLSNNSSYIEKEGKNPDDGAGTNSVVVVRWIITTVSTSPEREGNDGRDETEKSSHTKSADEDELEAAGFQSSDELTKDAVDGSEDGEETAAD